MDKEQTNEQTKRIDEWTDEEKTKNKQRTVNQTMNIVRNDEETHGWFHTIDLRTINLRKIRLQTRIQK